MKIWEYKTIKIDTKGFRGGILDTDEFDGILNRLGQQGWELVSAFSTTIDTGASREAVAVFKRSDERS